MNINPGLNAVADSGTETPLRQMANGSSRLKYNLYKNVGRTVIWGAGVDSGGNLHTGTGITKSIVGFARLNAGQVVPDGAYSDTITISVDY
jgi:spore coat protein U-like protein